MLEIFMLKSIQFLGQESKLWNPGENWKKQLLRDFQRYVECMYRIIVSTTWGLQWVTTAPCWDQQVVYTHMQYLRQMILQSDPESGDQDAGDPINP